MSWFSLCYAARMSRPRNIPDLGCLPVERRIRMPAILDFDELFSSHQAMLPGIMASAATLARRPSSFEMRRAQFLALREWIQLSSAFAIPLYACETDREQQQPRELWLRIGHHWIREQDMDGGMFADPTVKPHDPITWTREEDPAMRVRINIWLLQIEQGFQHWWQHDPEGCLAIQEKPDGSLRDVSEEVFSLPADLRQSAVATNRWPGCVEGGQLPGRLFLHIPSGELVGMRRSQQEHARMQGQVEQTTKSKGTNRL